MNVHLCTVNRNKNNLDNIVIILYLTDIFVLFCHIYVNNSWNICVANLEIYTGVHVSIMHTDTNNLDHVPGFFIWLPFSSIFATIMPIAPEMFVLESSCYGHMSSVYYGHACERFGQYLKYSLCCIHICFHFRYICTSNSCNICARIFSFFTQLHFFTVDVHSNNFDNIRSILIFKLGSLVVAELNGITEVYICVCLSV